MELRSTGWAATVGTAIALQWSVVLVLAAVASIWGSRAGVSLLLGGATVAVPHTLLAGWLTVRLLRHGGAGPVAMLGGEMLKLGTTIVLLFAVGRANPGLSFGALIIGVIGALKAQWLAVWFTRNY